MGLRRIRGASPVAASSGTVRGGRASRYREKRADLPGSCEPLRDEFSNMRRLITVAIIFLVASVAQAAEIHPPAQTVAGNPITIASSGSGDATFYLIGPASASKRQVQTGSDIAVDSDQIEHAGRYVAILCASDGCASSSFFVNAAAPNRLSLLVHPSRVPVGSANGISTVAFVFDNFHNLVLKPDSIKFSVQPKGGNEVSADRESKDGIAWVRL